MVIITYQKLSEPIWGPCWQPLAAELAVAGGVKGAPGRPFRPKGCIKAIKKYQNPSKRIRTHQKVSKPIPIILHSSI